MKKIILKNSDSSENGDKITLMAREASCNFCGEIKKRVIKGSVKVGDDNADICFDCVSQIAVYGKMR